MFFARDSLFSHVSSQVLLISQEAAQMSLPGETLPDADLNQVPWHRLSWAL